MPGPNGFEFDAYIAMLCDPDYSDYSYIKFAEELGVKVSLVYDWNGKVDWESIKSERRKRYAKLMPKVDNALFKATQKGDVPAIRTFYERFDSWTPASKVVTEHSISEAEIDEELNGLIERKRAAIDAISSSTVDEPGRNEASTSDSGAPSPEAGRADTVLQAESGATEIR